MATPSRFAPPLPATLDAGNITRQRLRAVLSAGIPHILNRIKVRAEQHRGEFWGWRIVEMEPALARDVVMKPGDVVREINDMPIARPDELLAIWKTLPRAHSISLLVVRGDQPCRIRYRIVDGPIAVTCRRSRDGCAPADSAPSADNAKPSTSTPSPLIVLTSIPRPHGVWPPAG